MGLPGIERVHTWVYQMILSLVSTSSLCDNWFSLYKPIRQYLTRLNFPGLYQHGPFCERTKLCTPFEEKAFKRHTKYNYNELNSARTKLGTDFIRHSSAIWVRTGAGKMKSGKVWCSFDVDNHVLMILKDVPMWSKILSRRVHIAYQVYKLYFQTV